MRTGAAQGESSPAERLADVYQPVFEALLPTEPPVSLRYAEVFGIAPERYDPFAPGLRQVHPFTDLGALPANRPYPIRGSTSEQSLTSDEPGGVLRVFVGPVEWQGPDDVVVEAGVSLDGNATGHWVWRLGRMNATWVVLRCELVWRA